MIKNLFLKLFLLMALSSGASLAMGAPACFEIFTNSEAIKRDLLATEYPTYTGIEEAYQKALELLPEDMRNNDGSYTRHQGDPPVLSIVVPAYREALRLPGSIQKMKDFFGALPFPVEIMIRIEKSPDNTVEVAQAAAEGNSQIQVFDHGVQKGKGYAVKQGMLEAHGRFVLFMDADLSTPLPEVYNFLARMAQEPNIDVLIGDRHHPDSQITQLQSFKRQVMGSTFRGITLTALGMFGLKGIYDTQCGFKLFTAEAADNIFNRIETNGFAFDVEALMYASQLGYTVKSSPIQWVDDNRSTVNPIWDPIKMLRDIGLMSIHVRRNLQMQTHP